MQGLSASLFVFSVLTSGAAYAHQRAAVDSVPPASQVRTVETKGDNRDRVPLYYVYSDDITHAMYWSTPIELGGGAEQNVRARALIR